MMNKLIRLSVLFLLGGLIYGCGITNKAAKNNTSASSVGLNNQIDTASYVLGHKFISDWKSKGLDTINPEVVQLAIAHFLSGDSLWLNEAYLVDESAKIEAALANKLIQKRIQEGVDFLLENGKRPGITTTPSGLQYEVLEAGNGPLPLATDQVKTHYEGRLIDGTVFDSSYKRGQPAVFPLRGVIKGWTEALQLMPVGSKYRLYIPHELGYGARGAGAMIQPYATLIFDVELIEIVK